MKVFLGRVWRHSFAKFLVSGGLNTLICLLLFYGLLRGDVNYILASTIMFVFGVVEGYFFSALLVFKHRLNFRHLFKYCNIYCISYGANIGLLYVCVEFFATSKLAGQIITSLLVAILNYLLVKRLVFISRK